MLHEGGVKSPLSPYVDVKEEFVSFDADDLLTFFGLLGGVHNS